MSLGSRLERLERINPEGGRELWICLGGRQPTEAEREAARLAARAEGMDRRIYVWGKGAEAI